MSRDLRGYGGKWPAVQWPGGARVAVSIVVNFEEGGELTVSGGDARNEAVYEVIDEKRGMRDLAIESRLRLRDAGRVLADRRGAGSVRGEGDLQRVRAGGGGCAVVGARRRGARARGGGARVSVGVARGDERGGGAGEHRRLHSRDRGGDRAAAGRVAHAGAGDAADAGVAGRARVSIRQRRVRRRSALLRGRRRARHLVLPYAFDTNDMHFQHSDRFTTAASFATYVTDAYDCLWREGERWPRMLSIGLHLRMIGRPGRIGALERILAHVGERGGGWLATREQIAQHWLEDAH